MNENTLNYDWRIEMEDDERLHACDFCAQHYYDIDRGHSCRVSDVKIEYPSVPNDCRNWEWLHYCHGFGFNGSKRNLKKL